MDKKEIAKKILEAKRKIHEFTRAGKSVGQLAKESGITLARPI